MAEAKGIYILMIKVCCLCCYSFGILCFSREKTETEKQPCVKKTKERNADAL